MNFPNKGYYFKFLDYLQQRNRGNYWLALLEQFIPYSQFIDMLWAAIIVKITIVGAKFWTIILYGFLFFCYKIFMELIRLGITKLDHKYNLQKTEIDWNSKNKKYNTYNIELKETVQSIAKVVGAEDRFNELTEVKK